VGLGGYNPGAVSTHEFRVERKGGEVTLQVDVPAEAIQRKERELLALARAKFRIPGFRAGMAPDHLVLRHYGEEDFARDLKEDLIQEWLERALTELGLDPVTTPTVETLAFARNERLAFQARFAVLPEVAVPDEVPVVVPEPPPAAVTEEEVEGVLAGLRRDAAVLEPKAGPAEEGDVVRLQRGGRDWEGEATASRPIGKQLLGVQSGQKVTLSDGEGHAETFSVTGVYRVVLPTLEETAQHYGQPTWEEFAAAVRERVQAIAEAQRLRAWRLGALDAAAEALGVEVPPTLLAEAVAEELRELRLPSSEKPRLEEAVRRKLRREIVAQRIAEAKGLLPTADEVRARAQDGERDEGAVRAGLVIERAADWVIAHARRNE